MSTSQRPDWPVDDEAFWLEQGRSTAWRNLLVSIPSLLCGFAVWLYWGMIAKLIQTAHFASNGNLYTFGYDSPIPSDRYRALMFTLPAAAGLAGATFRIPHSFLVAICGGRNVIALTTLGLIVPAVLTGLALQDPQVSFYTLVALAALSGLGGGAFASSMSNISGFFPKRMQGLALGLNAGLGNLGVSAMQFLIPWVVTFALFGGQPLSLSNPAKSLWIQNSTFIWAPIMALLVLLAISLMNNLPQHRPASILASALNFIWLNFLGLLATALGLFLLLLDWGPFPELLKILIVLVVTISFTMASLRFLTPASLRIQLQRQFSIFSNKHNWIMTWLYTMAFGSFIGYANAFPKLIDDVFGVIRVGSDGLALAQAIPNPNAPVSANFIWIGAGVGALIRPFGGWLADKFGGARVTHWDCGLMIIFSISAGLLVAKAGTSPQPETYFPAFLTVFVLLFATTGIANGSTFQMVPSIFSKEQAGAVLGWTSAVAAYGAFIIPTVFATQIRAGKPEYALYGFALYYLTSLALNWYFYARANAEIRA